MDFGGVGYFALSAESTPPPLNLKATTTKNFANLTLGAAAKNTLAANAAGQFGAARKGQFAKAFPVQKIPVKKGAFF
ncbi:hypothetical protein HK104_009855 [Borealophlyctis nickersoniae]|nr:hypothetical protein HK104_009855 [Borealophlyctis nickersoniae]